MGCYNLDLYKTMILKCDNMFSEYKLAYKSIINNSELINALNAKILSYFNIPEPEKRIVELYFLNDIQYKFILYDYDGKINLRIKTEDYSLGNIDIIKKPEDKEHVILKDDYLLIIDKTNFAEHYDFYLIEINKLRSETKHVISKFLEGN